MRVTRTIGRSLKPWAVLITALLLAFAGPAAGQGRGPGGGRGAGPALLRDSLPQAGPIDLLLARRDTFGLTAAQVRRLETVQAELRAQNAPLIHDLIALRREVQPLIGRHPRDLSSSERELFARHAARARPLLQQVQQNNVRAMARVSDVLTPTQKREVRVWLEGSGLLEQGQPGQRRRNRWGQERGGSGVAP